MTKRALHARQVFDEWLTLPEAADRIGISAPLLRTWRHRGKGPIGHRIGTVVLFRVADVEAWLSERKAS